MQRQSAGQIPGSMITIFGSCVMSSIIDKDNSKPDRFKYNRSKRVTELFEMVDDYIEEA